METIDPLIRVKPVNSGLRGAHLSQPDIRCAVISSLSEFLLLKNNWNRLLEQSDRHSVFQRWEWAYCWLKTFTASGVTLHVIQLFNAGELIAIAPFYIKKSRLGLVQELRFIGTGEPENCEVVTEQLDIIAHPAFKSIVIQGIAREVSLWLSESGRLSLFRSLDSHENTLVYKVYHKLKTDFCHLQKSTKVDYYWDLRRDGGDPEALDRSRKKRLGRSRRALDKEGGLQRFPAQSKDEALANYNVLKDLHETRWQKKGSIGAFASRRFNQFHRSLLGLLHDTGHADVVLYKVGEEVEAALYCLYSPSSATYYQSGYNPATANRFMPLTHAHYSEASKSRDAGRIRYDFLRGTRDSYKASFRCSTVPLLDLTIFGNRWTQRLENLIGCLRSVKAATASRIRRLKS